jgi:hypothetical protein
MSSFEVTNDNNQHNLDQVNYYRRVVGAPPLQLDMKLTAYAIQGSQELLENHTQHRHNRKTPLASVYEIQSYICGWPLGQSFGSVNHELPPAMNVNEQIDRILAQMFMEGPPPAGHYNHYSIMTNPNAERLGVGLVINQRDDLLDPSNPLTPASCWRGSLYLTNDFFPEEFRGESPEE